MSDSSTNIRMDQKYKTIVKQTNERLKRFTMLDLKKVFESITEAEAKIMVNNIKQGRFDKCAQTIAVCTYREMQKEVNYERD